MEDGEGRSPKAPDWLPDGWTMKIRTRKDGKMDRYYISPVSGYTFRSRVEVMRYLNVEKGDEGLPVTTACPEEGKPCVTECSEEDKPCDVAQVKNSPKWLPSGWTVEFRSCQSDTTARKKKKCYIDPSTGSSFCSKAEVFRYLKTGKSSNSLPKKKKLLDTEPKEEPLSKSTSNQKNINSDSKDDIVTLIETSPNGLPPGWIKEVKCKKTASGVRKDPYYTDPVSGYVFRSKKDVFRYIEAGEISKHAIKSKTKRSADKMLSVENESPLPLSAKKLKSRGEGTLVQQCVFEGKVRKSSRNSTKENNGLHKDSSSPATNRALLQCELSSGPSYEAPLDVMFLNDKKVKTRNLVNPCENELPENPLEAADEEALDQVIEKLLDSVSKSAPGTSNGKWSDPVSENLQNKSNTEWSEVQPKEKNESQSCGQADKSVEPPPKKQLEFVGIEAEMMEKWKSVEFTETACNVRVKPSKEKSQEFGVNKKMELADQDGKLSEPEEKLIRSNLSEPVESLKLAYGKISGQGIEESKDGNKTATEVARPRKSRMKSEKSASIGRRASKRLAGLEAEPAVDIELGDKSLKRGRPSTQKNPRTGLDDNREVDTEPPKAKEETFREQIEVETLKFNNEDRREQVDVEELDSRDRTIDKDLDCTVASPFGDSWPDPCIEFAFKTLTGEIPVLDTTTMQGFLHEQLSSVQTPFSDVPHSSAVGDCPNGPIQPVQTQVSSAGEDHSLTENNMLPQTSGKVKKLCRRRMSGK